MRAAYCALVVLRAAMCFAPGYVHPDEFHQAPEVMAGAVLGVAHKVPWEFAPESPAIRSPAIAMAATGVPLFVAKWLSGGSALPPKALFAVPRIAAFLLSFLNDISLASISRRTPEAVPLWPALLAFGAAWPTLVLLVRPLSNAVEAALLAACIALVPHATSKRLHAAVLGALCAAGVFARPTFVLFAGLPFAVAFGCRAAIGSSSLGLRIRRVLGALLFAAFAACFVGSVLVAFDTRWYGDGIVVAPLRFVEYNSNPANLALHGSHPHWLHFVVNTPMLFAPLLPFAFPQMLRKHSPSSPLGVCTLVVLSGLALLSTAPHQEARFLAPLTAPLVVLAALPISQLAKRRKSALAVGWIVFNLSLAIYFGVLHQGGVAPALVHIGDMERATVVGSNSSAHVGVVFFHTYMPPRHLLAWPGDGSRGTLVFRDLGGGSSDELARTLQELSESVQRCWVAMPATVSERAEVAKALAENGAFLHKSVFPHISNEDPPSRPTLGHLSLEIFLVNYGVRSLGS